MGELNGETGTIRATSNANVFSFLSKQAINQLPQTLAVAI